MNDRELLELAAKAAGRCIVDWIGDGNWVSIAVLDDGSRWQPLHENQFTDCMGDALRLATRLHIDLEFYKACVEAIWIDEALSETHTVVEYCDEEIDGWPAKEAATRRAIFRAAAEIGKAMP